MAVTGRLRRVTCWVPLEKVQSVRRVQGPLQRALHVATVHVDVAGRRVDARFKDRDEHEADRLVDELADAQPRRAHPAAGRRAASRAAALTAPAARRASVVGTGVDPVTSRFSGARSAN